MKRISLLTVLLALLFGPAMQAQEGAKPAQTPAVPTVESSIPAVGSSISAFGPPIELGLVPWRRDFEASLLEAERSAKPVLLLFQEVPG
jgi:hypothetical protein